MRHLIGTRRRQKCASRRTCASRATRPSPRSRPSGETPHCAAALGGLVSHVRHHVRDARAWHHQLEAGPVVDVDDLDELDHHHHMVGPDDHHNHHRPNRLCRVVSCGRVRERRVDWRTWHGVPRRPRHKCHQLASVWRYRRPHAGRLNRGGPTYRVRGRTGGVRDRPSRVRGVVTGTTVGTIGGGALGWRHCAPVKPLCSSWVPASRACSRSAWPRRYAHAAMGRARHRRRGKVRGALGSAWRWRGLLWTFAAALAARLE